MKSLIFSGEIPLYRIMSLTLPPLLPFRNAGAGRDTGGTPLWRVPALTMGAPAEMNVRTCRSRMNAGRIRLIKNGMKYYIERSQYTRPKNKAQAHVQKFTEMFFNMLVGSDEDLNSLIESIKREVEKTGSEYRNCKKMEVTVDRYPESDAVNIRIHTGADSSCSIAWIHARRVYSEYQRGFVQKCLL
jgi:hypothetical protein